MFTATNSTTLFTLNFDGYSLARVSELHSQAQTRDQSQSMIIAAISFRKSDIIDMLIVQMCKRFQLLSFLARIAKTLFISSRTSMKRVIVSRCFVNSRATFSLSLCMRCRKLINTSRKRERSFRYVSKRNLSKNISVRSNCGIRPRVPVEGLPVHDRAFVALSYLRGSFGLVETAGARVN